MTECEPDASVGGATGSGGAASGTGGRASGGQTGGGGAASGSGGAATGGANASGGASATGGATGSGGASTGGAKSTGGSGGASTGGATGTGGAASKCGNGTKDTGEECDDGNRLDLDECTSICTDNAACKQCALENLDPPISASSCEEYVSEYDPTGGTIVSKKDRPPAGREGCYAVFRCVQESQCFAENGFQDCFCGKGISAEECKDGRTDGPCADVITDALRAEIETGGRDPNNPSTLTEPIPLIIYDNSTRVDYGALFVLATVQGYYLGGCSSPTTGGQGECLSGTPQGTGGTPSTGGTANTGGVPNTGGAANTGGGVSTGGTANTGGAASTGGTSNTGGATNTGGMVSAAFCAPPKTEIPGVAASCLQCEQNNCDAPLPTGCDHFPAGSAERNQCRSAINCIRTTNCNAVGGALSCFCGPTTDIVGCKANLQNPNGACKAEIIAGYPSGSTASFIVDNSTKLDYPASFALALAQCDYAYCGPAEGLTECVPYCQ